jgi:hypothetical protein
MIAIEHPRGGLVNPVILFRAGMIMAYVRFGKA